MQDNWVRAELGAPSVYVCHAPDGVQRAQEAQAWLTGLGLTCAHTVGEADAALILMTPEWHGAPDCAADLALARARGLPCALVRLGPGPATGVLASLPAFDLSGAGGDVDLMRSELERFLVLHLGDAAAVFEWTGAVRGESPYQGLRPFTETEAGLYFGRDRALRQVLQRLRAAAWAGRADRPAAPLLVMGPEGSGISSLLGAGVLPRLLQEPEHWIVLPMSDARQDAVWGLADAIAGLLESIGEPAAAEVIAGQIQGALAAGGPALTTLFHDLATRLRTAQSAPEARIVWPVDALDRLLPAGEDEGQSALLRLIYGAAARGWHVLAGARSEAAGRLMAEPVLSHFSAEPLFVPPMDTAARIEAIEGPARRAGLHLDPGLSQTMAADAAGPDALPALSYSLARMWDSLRREAERMRAPQGLTEAGADPFAALPSPGWASLEIYTAIGRTAAAVARAADQSLDVGSLSSEALAALGKVMRGCFWAASHGTGPGIGHGWQAARADLSALAPEIAVQVEALASVGLFDIGEEHGVRWAAPASDALVRLWPHLAGWLGEAQDRRALAETAARAAHVWAAAGEPASGLVHGGIRLKAAREALAQTGEGSAKLAQYLTACDAREAEITGTAGRSGLFNRTAPRRGAA